MSAVSSKAPSLPTCRSCSRRNSSWLSITTPPGCSASRCRTNCSRLPIRSSNEAAVVHDAAWRRGRVAARGAGAATSCAAMKKRGHETTKLKGRNAPPVAPHRGPTAADLQKQLDFHTRKLAETRSKLDQQSRLLSEALDQQKATSEVLRVISNSPIDLQSALGAIAESAARLLDVAGAEIDRLEGDGLRLIAKHGALSQRPIGSVRPITRGLVIGRAVIDRTTVHVPDLRAAESEFPEGAESARRYGHRT